MLEKPDTRASDEVVHPDARRSRLRALLTRVNRTVPAVTLQVAWHELIETLDLGPEPVTIRCPQCGAIVMRDATRCGHCWKYLNH